MSKRHTFEAFEKEAIILCGNDSNLRKCEPVMNKCGWNNSSCSFSLKLPLDPLSGG